jgi:hypothetical protein
VSPGVRPTTSIALRPDEKQPPRARIKFLSRFIIPSDGHGFVGRIYDLSIVSYHFDSYDALAKHADCKYVYDVNFVLTVMTRRVESLNVTADMLWPEPLPSDFKAFPINRYNWLTLATDAFLMRYISVVDCAIILSAEVFETGLDARKCSIDNLRKAGVPSKVLAILRAIVDDQGTLRDERNSRFHHGHERSHTDDDQTFQMASIFERTNGITGTDRYGRMINLDRSFKEGLVKRQKDFNRTSRAISKRLNGLYDELWNAFEERFIPRIRGSTHGLSNSPPTQDRRI